MCKSLYVKGWVQRHILFIKKKQFAATCRKEAKYLTTRYSVLSWNMALVGVASRGFAAAKAQSRLARLKNRVTKVNIDEKQKTTGRLRGLPQLAGLARWPLASTTG